MIMLDGGRVVASGSPAEMMQSHNELVQAFMASEHAG
jgi:ABC-type transporter Mla maintaining outer membrane lipid asymmetry ATPase subunit MlaF